MVLKFPLVFPGRQVEKRMFPYRKSTAYITVPSATALACDAGFSESSNSDLYILSAAIVFYIVTRTVKH